jgi:tetratricopeptide (TPR) repeat protein
LDPTRAAGHFGLGNIAMQLGRTAEARAAFEQADVLAPDHPRYHRALAETARFTRGDDPWLLSLNRLAKGLPALPDDQKVELHFALAKACDDLGHYDEAFGQFKDGNAIQRRRVTYDETAVASFFDSIVNAFSPALMATQRGAGDPSNLPVFIVGMPRSGSTLVEQILASHPAVFGAGELVFMNDIVAAIPDYPSGVAELSGETLARLGQRYVERLRSLAPDAARIVDKLPPNFRHLGLINLILPNAKIIHVHRDPIATCFSCYSKLFLGGLNFTYDMGELGRYHKMYEALMAHWRAVLPPHALLDVEYETLVGDFEVEARRVVDFVGLPWDARCLDFAKTKRPVRTLSQSQVRQPLFASSIEHWRHYERHLGPLIDALASPVRT